MVNRSNIVRTVAIATVLAVILTSIEGYFTASFFEHIDAPGQDRLLTGFAAISRAVQTFGALAFVKGLVPHFVLYFLGIFVGGLLVQRQKKSDE